MLMILEHYSSDSLSRIAGEWDEGGFLKGQRFLLLEGEFSLLE